MKNRFHARCTAVALVALAVAGLAPPADAQDAQPADAAQAKRLEALKAAGREASVAIYPVVVLGKPDRNVADALGLVLEKSGMTNLDGQDAAFAPPADAAWDKMPVLFAEFLRQNPPKSDYALFAQFLGQRQSGPTEVRFLITTAKGELILSDVQTSQDRDFKRTAARDPDPMGCSVLVAERVFGQLNWKKGSGAADGRYARLWAEKSGTPTDAERKEMKQRTETLKTGLKHVKLSVYATRIGDTGNAESGAHLAQLIGKKFGMAAATAETAIAMELKPSSNEQKRLWDLARAFREHLRANPPDAEYALLAEYYINPAGGPAGAVHVVICTKAGDWVIVDFQNNLHDDFQKVAPKTIADCDDLALRRLAHYLE